MLDMGRSTIVEVRVDRDAQAKCRTCNRRGQTAPTPTRPEASMSRDRIGRHMLVRGSNPRDTKPTVTQPPDTLYDQLSHVKKCLSSSPTNAPLTSSAPTARFASGGETFSLEHVLRLAIDVRNSSQQHACGRAQATEVHGHAPAPKKSSIGPRVRVAPWTSCQKSGSELQSPMAELLELVDARSAHINSCNDDAPQTTTSSKEVASFARLKEPQRECPNFTWQSVSTTFPALHCLCSRNA